MQRKDLIKKVMARLVESAEKAGLKQKDIDDLVKRGLNLIQTIEVMKDNNLETAHEDIVSNMDWFLETLKISGVGENVSETTKHSLQLITRTKKAITEVLKEEAIRTKKSITSSGDKIVEYLTKKLTAEEETEQLQAVLENLRDLTTEAEERIAELAKGGDAIAKTVETARAKWGSASKELKEAVDRKQREKDTAVPEELEEGLPLIKDKRDLEKTKKEDKKKEKTNKPGGARPSTTENEPVTLGPEGAISSVWFRAAEDDMSFMKDLDEFNSAVAELEPFVEAAESMAQGLSELDSKWGEAAQMAESDMPSDAPEKAAPEEDAGEGWFDPMMDALIPEPQMTLEPASDKSGVTREAKTFNARDEHDLSTGFMEISEEGGQKKLVIRKDLKGKVSRRVEDYFKGRFSKDDEIAIDLGDRIAPGTVESYSGEGVYKIKTAEGRSLDVPEKYLFEGGQDLWR